MADTQIARVDEFGFLRGIRAGTTLLIAGAGGLLWDTAQVRVRPGSADTLLVEDWSGGLSASLWKLLGQPLPFVVDGAPPDGRAAFFNNGDYNHFSGTVSWASFEVGSAGLTLEVDAWVDFNGGEWQVWSTGLTTSPAAELGPELDVTVPGTHLALAGPGTVRDGPDWAATIGHKQRAGALDLDSSDRRWHRAAIQVRPDTVAELYMNGNLLYRDKLPSSDWGRSFSIVLQGFSVDTRLYHGRVVLTRGLRY